MSPSIAAQFAALAILPLAFGIGGGLLVRRARGPRVTGIPCTVALCLAPMVLAVAGVLIVPVIGVWDALLEGFLVGLGLAVGTHRRSVHADDAVLAAVALVAGLALAETMCRVLLPAAPGFPNSRAPHFLLADAMRAATQSLAWDLGSKEMVCALLYEERYPGILDVSGVSDIVTPRSFAPRADATRRVLHIGDSMAFGFGVAREQTFTAALTRLEPDVQHVNAGIPGAAPDAYLAVLRRWLALHRFDAVIVHLFEGNDVDSLDDRYPCCGWEPLLAYDDARPRLRCPDPAPVDFRKAGATWLLYNSPPPFLVRALVPYSDAASHLAAAIVNGTPHMPRGVQQPLSLAMSHLESILRAARDDLRERKVAFAVVVLPNRAWVEEPEREHLAPEIVDLSRRLDVATLDASELFRAEHARGAESFLPIRNDPHFSAVGHDTLAAWLHQMLPKAIAPPPPS